MAQDMDWSDLANMWWDKFEGMQTDPTPSRGVKRGRSRSRTPTSKKRSDRAPSRAKGMQPRRLTFSSARTRSRSRSASVSKKKVTWGKAAKKAANNRKSPTFVKKITLDRLTRNSKVRHNLTRKKARKSMPRGKPYTRPKGRKGYRGAVLPRWARGETKHVLVTDGHSDLTAAAGSNASAPTVSSTEVYKKMSIGAIEAWSMNPIKQGNDRSDRTGASVDGQYLRIQGHIHNRSKDTQNQIDGQTIDSGKQRCYVRMLALAVKGGRAVGASGTAGRPKANFDKVQLFKKIDGSVVGFDTTQSAGKASLRIRSLQLGVNKQYYTVLADRKIELAGADEGFGASDRLFDLKMKLKQRTTWADSKCDSFEKNQIIFVVMTVDPNMDDGAIDVNQADSRHETIQLEFESKYSYKDL